MKITNLLTASVLFLYGTGEVKSQLQTVHPTTIQAENQIEYLFFKVIKDPSGEEKISLVEKEIVKGKLKSMPVFNQDDVKNGDFLIILTDREGKEIIKQNIDDPLNPELESYGDDMGRHRLKLNESEFSIRFPYSEEIKSVKIEKITNSKSQLLFTQNF